ncbi:hypothetical protein GH5_01435 [Leishmania sp. Ghana 2012 LV757]|uniref:hypothetical protein n=1 Tax=Leishmania sp. Ghana 2012 LV757 TaxID=2803181 RepID=UPI001B4B0865|nr:hypothetical protein GH5_01435 [Leishmania sp. Ghana 2012 LV757]
MSFFSLLFGNDVRVMEDKNVRTPRDGARKTALHARVGRHDVHPKVVMKTPIGLVPLMSLRRFRGPKRSRLHSVAIPANRDGLSLWSLLLCRPEVYDPRVEAAPLPSLLDVNKPHVMMPHAERAEQQQERAAECERKEADLAQQHSSSSGCSGMGRCDDVPRGDDEEGHRGAEDTVMSSSMLNASSDVDECAETDTQSHSDGPDAAESLLHPHTFHVFDTRRCRGCTSTALPCSASVAFFTTSPLPCGSIVPSPDTTKGGAASSCGSTAITEGRLISRKELAKKRLQMRQQSKEAAKRAREYKKAWVALVASACPHANTAKSGEATRHANSRLADDSGSPHPAAIGASVTAAAVPLRLTNEALEPLRRGTLPLTYDLPAPFLARLGHYTQLPRKARDGAEAAVAALAEGSDRAESCCSFSSDSSSQVALNGGLANMEAGLPVMYGSILKCCDSASKLNDVSCRTVAPRPHRKPEVVPGRRQRIPAGKYPLGSREYVERVLFAQRRQQECALLALLTEAHRQAREAHLRLAQLYYYYVIPILAQYSTEDEVSGLERSLLQCGSGALRMFHTEFCFTTVRSACVPRVRGSGGTSDFVARTCQVQPVDYQLAEYRFEKVWRELFLEVKTYLGLQAREDANCSDGPTLSGLEDGVALSSGSTSTGPGSVCVAATVLHSMELFERQRHTHNAARDAEEWLAWYYCYFIPHVQRASSAEERTAIQRSLLPPPPPLPPVSKSETEMKGRGDGAHACANDPKPRQPHPLENEYLPLSWTCACDTAEREKVLGYRRDLRMRVIESAVADRAADRGDSAAASEADHISAAGESKPTFPSIACSVAETRRMGGASAAAVSSGFDALKHVPDSGGFLSSAHQMKAMRKLARNVETGVEEASLRKASAQLLADGSINKQNYDTVEVEVRDSEETEDEEDAIPSGVHQTVNVGCFGLSFFSIFD